MAQKSVTRILVPPGIGDIYWVLVKLRSFIAKNRLANPELTIVSYPDDMDSHLRSIPFLEMIPWITIGDPQFVPNARGLEKLWDEAYAGPGRSIFPEVMGYDYLISYNGCINSGGWIETADEYECDWSIPVDMPPATRAVEGRKKFMLCFFPFIGTYASHEQDFPIPLIADSINKFSADTDIVPVFMGGKLEQLKDERRHELMKLVPSGIDLAGKTSIIQVLCLLRGCQLLYGYHSGIPNLGAAIGKPSVFLWDDRFPPSTSYACMPPYVRETTYHAMPTKGLTVDSVVRKLHDVYISTA